MAFNFEEAFRKGLTQRKATKRAAQDLKLYNFNAALSSFSETINQLRIEGIPDELESPVSDWLEEFYEHGCVWLNEDLKRLSDLWLKK